MSFTLKPKMNLEEIEGAIKDGSIYLFSAQQLKECLKVIAEQDVGGNPNFHARLLKDSSFVNYLLSDINSKEQLQQTTRTANWAIAISIVSIAASVLIATVTYSLSLLSGKY
jgi:hypothetical protein